MCLRVLQGLALLNNVQAQGGRQSSWKLFFLLCGDYGQHEEGEHRCMTRVQATQRTCMRCNVSLALKQLLNWNELSQKCKWQLWSPVKVVKGKILWGSMFSCLDREWGFNTTTSTSQPLLGWTAPWRLTIASKQLLFTWHLSQVRQRLSPHSCCWWVEFFCQHLLQSLILPACSSRSKLLLCRTVFSFPSNEAGARITLLPSWMWWIPLSDGLRD